MLKIRKFHHLIMKCMYMYELTSWNCPKSLLSVAISLSPWWTLISTCVWPSAAVENTWYKIKGKLFITRFSNMPLTVTIKSTLDSNTNDWYSVSSRNVWEHNHEQGYEFEKPRSEGSSQVAVPKLWPRVKWQIYMGIWHTLEKIHQISHCFNES